MNTKHGHLIERAAARLRSPLATHTLSSNLASNELATVRASSIPKPPPPSQSSYDRIPKPAIGMDALTNAGLLGSGAESGRAAEEFRIAQSKLLRDNPDPHTGTARGQSNLVMVTSALKGEGKSFVSINLAGEVARHSDRKVLLIDADPKPGGLTRRLGVANARGLLDIAGDSSVNIADAIISTAVPYLDVLPFGQAKNSTGELFASRHMRQAIEAIAHHSASRLVIFDAPPCLASSIPHTVAGLMGQIVLVIAANYTQLGDIEATLDLVSACPNISLLLNKIPTWSGHPFGAYDYAAG